MGVSYPDRKPHARGPLSKDEPPRDAKVRKERQNFELALRPWVRAQRAWSPWRFNSAASHRNNA